MNEWHSLKRFGTAGGAKTHRNHCLCPFMNDADYASTPGYAASRRPSRKSRSIFSICGRTSATAFALTGP